MKFKSVINKIIALEIVAGTAISATSCGMTEPNNSTNSNLPHPIELVDDNDKATNSITEEPKIKKSNEKQTTIATSSMTTQPVSILISTEKNICTVTSSDSAEGKVVSSVHSVDIENQTSIDSTYTSKNEQQVTSYPTELRTTVQTNVTASTTHTTKNVQPGDGTVLIIAEFYELMGNQPLRVSKSEAEILIGMFNEIELEPVDQPVPPDDPANEVLGGGYIMYIEGGNKITIMGNRNVKIGDKYYYDANNKSDALAGKIGYVLYDYYGEP